MYSLTFFIIIIICMNIFLSIFVPDCFIIITIIILFFYNQYSYLGLLPVLHLYACMYMGFVPEK